MYICESIHVYIQICACCAHAYVHACIHVGFYMCVHVYGIYTYTYVYVAMCVHVYMLMCFPMCVSMYECGSFVCIVCICVCMW